MANTGYLDPSTINSSADLLQLVRTDTTLQRVAATGGGEYAGPCPRCGGKDRFRVQLVAPFGKKPQGSRWMCRSCHEKWGNAISYVMWRDQLDFVQAMRQLARGQKYGKENSEEVVCGQEEQPINRLTWASASFDFIEMCADALWKPEGQPALDYLHWRGLQDDTLVHWDIGYNPVSGYGRAAEWGMQGIQGPWLPRGITIPCQDAGGLHYVKIRQRDAEPKYVVVKGGEVWPFGLISFRDCQIAMLFEGEFDVLLAWQSGLKVGYAALPAGQALKPAYNRFFQDIDDVVVAYDADPSGRQAAAQLARIPDFYLAPELPEGKDLTEYYLLGGDVVRYLYDDALGVLDGPD